MLDRLTTKNWARAIEKHLPDGYMDSLGKALAYEYANNTVYPSKEDIFNAFKLTDYSDVSVLMLGLD